MRYQVEYTAPVYLTITVDAESFDDAQRTAENVFTMRYPVVVDLTDGLPEAFTSVTIGEDWDINSVEDETGETEYL